MLKKMKMDSTQNKIALLEVVKANIFLSQCILTVLDNVVKDYKLDKNINKEVYDNLITHNITRMRELSDSLTGSVQDIIDSMAPAPDTDSETSLQ